MCRSTFLGNPVADGGDPQRACLAWTLGDVHAPQGEGLKGTSRLEVAHQGAQILFEVRLEHRDAHLVDPRRAAIPPDVAKSAVHEVQGDPSRQRVVLDLGHVRLFPAETHETETSGRTPLPSRGGCCLAIAWPLRQRPLPSAAGCVPFREESSSKDFRTGTAPHG